MLGPTPNKQQLCDMHTKLFQYSRVPHVSWKLFNILDLFCTVIVYYNNVYLHSINVMRVIFIFLTDVLACMHM